MCTSSLENSLRPRATPTLYEAIVYFGLGKFVPSEKIPGWLPSDILFTGRVSALLTFRDLSGTVSCGWTQPSHVPRRKRLARYCGVTPDVTRSTARPGPARSSGWAATSIHLFVRRQTRRDSLPRLTNSSGLTAGGHSQHLAHSRYDFPARPIPGIPAGMWMLATRRSTGRMNPSFHGG